MLRCLAQFLQIKISHSIAESCILDYLVFYSFGVFCNYKFFKEFTNIIKILSRKYKARSEFQHLFVLVVCII